MSWTSRFGHNLGRFSPFTRSPTGTGRTKVSDSDFSYITADDLRRHQQETITEQNARSESPVDFGPQRETDRLVLKNKKNEYPVHFPAYSIVKNDLTVGEVRDAAAKKTKSNADRIKLLYRGKQLKDDSQTCKQVGLQDGSEILCTIGETSSESVSEDDDDDDDGIDAGEVDADGARRRRNRGKKTKRRNKREAAAATSGTSTPADPNLGIPLSQAAGSRTASPKPPPTPLTPGDKLNALQGKLNQYQSELGSFMRNPPADPAKREFEQKRLNETLMAQVLLKLDEVETEDADERSRRKGLVNETNRLLTELDKFKNR